MTLDVSRNSDHLAVDNGTESGECLRRPHLSSPMAGPLTPALGRPILSIGGRTSSDNQENDDCKWLLLSGTFALARLGVTPEPLMRFVE